MSLRSGRAPPDVLRYRTHHVDGTWAAVPLAASLLVFAAGRLPAQTPLARQWLVTVTDDASLPVTGLGAEDFALHGGGGAATANPLDQWMPLGDYTVTLQVAGETHTAPAHIVKTQGWSFGPTPVVIR